LKKVLRRLREVENLVDAASTLAETAVDRSRDSGNEAAAIESLMECVANDLKAIRRGLRRHRKAAKDVTPI
jgi:hypothetical protein